MTSTFSNSVIITILPGNPLSFHPKHRLKTVEVLSNLINPSSFRLDSKKLSNNEKKAIPRSLTHYPQSSPSLSSGTASQSPLHTHHTLTPPSNSQLMIGISPGHQSDAIVFSKVSHHYWLVTRWSICIYNVQLHVYRNMIILYTCTI